jgi:hypothetical protein
LREGEVTEPVARAKALVARERTVFEKLNTLVNQELTFVSSLG